MISKSLRLLRRFKGLSQTEIAQRLGVTKSWISEIESGKKEPTLNLLHGYADVLEIPLSSILFFSEQMDGDKPSERARTFVSKKVLAIMDYIDAHSREGNDSEDASPNTPSKTVPTSQTRKPSPTSDTT
ncbi:helix-turn-helix domain-containing protein [Brevundimonas sp. NPDC003935]|jgi:transcriptional regulator with XRE-family HTH domain|uniref:helix-turn-helix domain-containing protein n=1 Tax=unclassified Brevundimonas TaxID=2622653 RepID=UPI0036992990